MKQVILYGKCMGVKDKILFLYENEMLICIEKKSFHYFYLFPIYNEMLLQIKLSMYKIWGVKLLMYDTIYALILTKD